MKILATTDSLIEWPSHLSFVIFIAGCNFRCPWCYVTNLVFSEYAGEWVAVLDGKIIAYSKNFKEVYNLAKKNFPKERPLIGKLPKNMPMVLSFC